MAQPTNASAILNAPSSITRVIQHGYSFAAAVTDGAGASFTIPTSAIQVGSGGLLNVTMAGDSASVTLTVVEGVLPIRVTAVGNTAAGTTAAKLFALW